jgi:general stress protein CsbA
MKFVSGVFHPLILTTYLLIVFYFYQPDFFGPIGPSQIPRLLLAVFITTFIIPGLSILVMNFTSKVSSLSLSRQEERYLPYISIILFYGATCYLLINRIGLIPPLSSILIALTVLPILLLIITIKIKISAHAAAGWALAGILASISIKYSGTALIIPLTFSFLMAGIVTSSRLYLHKHTVREAWHGASIGFGCSFLGILLFG